MTDEYREWRRDLADAVWRVAHDAERLADSLRMLEVLGAAPEPPRNKRDIDAEFALGRGLDRAKDALNWLARVRDRASATLVTFE